QRPDEMEKQQTTDPLDAQRSPICGEQIEGDANGDHLGQQHVKSLVSIGCDVDRARARSRILEDAHGDFAIDCAAAGTARVSSSSMGRYRMPGGGSTPLPQNSTSSLSSTPSRWNTLPTVARMSRRSSLNDQCST